MKKQTKFSKEKLKKLAEALKKFEQKQKTKENNLIEENKFVESGIAFEKISPVLKPVARAHEKLEQITSSFASQKKSEDKSNEKPYEFGEQKYFSQSGEYKNINKMQSENLQIPTGVEKGMVHMGIEQATKRKSERFFDEEQEKKYSADIKPLEEVKKSEKKMYVSR